MYETNDNVEEHLVIIPVKFGQNPMSGFRGEVKKLTDDWRLTTNNVRSQ